MLFSKNIFSLVPYSKWVQVLSIVRRRPEVQKISFVAHSLGGLVARYAIGRLYESVPNTVHPGDVYANRAGQPAEQLNKPRIAGLEPVNFITVASPHLGSRGHRQVNWSHWLHVICFDVMDAPYCFLWHAATFFLLRFSSLQLPFLCGFPFLERSASQTAHWLVGRTGKHLFLTDHDDGKKPLLLRMATDSEDLRFM